MKSIVVIRLRVFCLFLLFALRTAPPVRGQDAKLQISHLDKLAAKADETVDVNIEGPLLQLAAKFLSNRKPDEAKVKDLITGLKGIYVKSFQFNKEGEYSEEDIRPIREQIRAPAWLRMVGIRSKRERENVEIFTRVEGDKMVGLAVISAEPRELTIINIVGAIDLDKLRELEGQFGIPRLGVQYEKRFERNEKRFERSGKSRKE